MSDGTNTKESREEWTQIRDNKVMFCNQTNHPDKNMNG
jgi:hypothetical protein